MMLVGRGGALEEAGVENVCARTYPKFTSDYDGYPEVTNSATKIFVIIGGQMSYGLPAHRVANQLVLL